MEAMTEEELQGWMKMVNTQMLELILTQSAGKPAWYRQAMAVEIQKRREAKRG